MSLLFFPSLVLKMSLVDFLFFFLLFCKVPLFSLTFFCLLSIFLLVEMCRSWPGPFYFLFPPFPDKQVKSMNVPLPFFSVKGVSSPLFSPGSLLTSFQIERREVFPSLKKVVFSFFPSPFPRSRPPSLFPLKSSLLNLGSPLFPPFFPRRR